MDDLRINLNMLHRLTLVRLFLIFLYFNLLPFKMCIMLNCVAFTFLVCRVLVSTFIMTKYTMKYQTCILFFTFSVAVFTHQNAIAQSISGAVTSFESKYKLGYATVDVHKDSELVASVLADKHGNFNVKLDSGTYHATILYAGYQAITQVIHVKNDEVVNFGLKKDKASTFISGSSETTEKEKDGARFEGGGMVSDTEDDIVPGAAHLTAGPHYPYKSKLSSTAIRGVGGTDRDRFGYPATPQQGVAGKLTAGEINDFSKWDLWTDLTIGEFDQYSKTWNYNARNRYMLQLTDKKGLPLANAKVQLVNKEGKRYYEARTDNTGKAELWEYILLGEQREREKLSISGEYEGMIFFIKKAVTVDVGINTYELAVDCNQSQRVDIAFVVDATGSMGDELNYLRAELNDVIFTSKEINTVLNFRFANVFYRDHTDAYLTKSQDFTRVLSESIAFISDQQAGGGGDFPEAVEAALDTAVNTLQWSEDARARILFLVLDAPPHNTPDIQERLRRISRQAAAKGIRIVPLVASGIDKGTEFLMRSIALATNGTYAFLTDDSGIGGSHLKPSTDSYTVETLNDLLVRIISTYTYMPDCEQELPDLDLTYPTDSVAHTLVDTTQSVIGNGVGNSAKPIDIIWNYYPNPTHGILHIKASVDIPELYITDLSGKALRVVKNIQQQEIVQVDLSSYATGVYLIRYPAGNRWVSGKVILNRG